MFDGVSLLIINELAPSVEGVFGGSKYTVTSSTVTTSNISSDLFNILKSEYKDIVFTKSTGTVSGTLSIINMIPSLFGIDRGGLKVEMNYTGAGDIGFIQFVATNTPLQNRPNTVVDAPGVLQGISPYYNSEKIPNIIDEPKRYLDSATANKAVEWTAFVFLARQAGNDRITVYDGIQYGFRVSKE